MTRSQWLSYDTVLKSNNNPISTVVNHDTDDFLLNILSRRREATGKEKWEIIIKCKGKDTEVELKDIYNWWVILPAFRKHISFLKDDTTWS